MFEILIDVFTDLTFIISFLVFISVITVLFYKQSKIRFNGDKKKNIKIKKNNEVKKVAEKKEEPGKLYVPDSTYEILKKEGLMHNIDE